MRSPNLERLSAATSALVEEEQMWERRSFCVTASIASLFGLLSGVPVASAETIRKSYDVKGFT